MPGIIGIISKSSSDNHEDTLNIMLNSMLHEKFYTHGKFIDHEKGYFIGYVSLEGSFSDCMPIYNEKRNLILFLTGECYIDDYVIDKLKIDGHKFQSDNASYIIHLYEKYGNDFLTNLNGWYNGIIIDLSKSIAYLFNDRYGLRRIYYYENNRALYFASEAKALLKAIPSLRKISLKSVGEYITYDCVLEDKTYFENVFLLPSGSFWSINKNNINKTRYFDSKPLEDQAKLNDDEFFEEFSDSFRNIIPRYFKGDPIGLSLSGGLDTRSILSCYTPSLNDLTCYTFSDINNKIYDVRYAPKVAKTLNLKHKIIPLDETEYFSEYPSRVVKSIYLSDGLQNVAMTDMLYFSEKSRDIAQIRISGMYGSQVIKKVWGLKKRLPYEKLLNSYFIKYINMAEETYADIDRNHKLSYLLKNEIPYWWNGVLASHSIYSTTRSPFLDYDLINLLYRAPDTSLNSNLQIKLIGL